MSIHDRSLKNGSYFYITNRNNNSQDDLALTFNSDSPTPQLSFQPLDESSPDQIWMVEEVTSNHYELVHAYSTLVLTASKDTAYMATGTWTQSQLFFLQKSDPKNNPLEYWIKSDKLSDLYLQYENKLKCLESNPKASKCRWELKTISSKNQIFSSCLIQFAYSSLYLDLPGSSMKSGVSIIQYKLNSRCNQRWKLVRMRQSSDYMVINVRSKMCLTVKGGRAKSGTAVVQELPHNEDAGQMWTLLHQGQSLYIIASALSPGLFLGIDNNSMNDNGKLVVTKSEEYAFWRVVGKVE